MRIYYAHCIAIYDTPQEQRDIETLQQLGFEVVNPNCPESANGYKVLGMEYFRQFADTCDAIAFRSRLACSRRLDFFVTRASL
jgi:hypothetical protein